MVTVDPQLRYASYTMIRHAIRRLGNARLFLACELNQFEVTERDGFCQGLSGDQIQAVKDADTEILDVITRLAWAHELPTVETVEVGHAE